jgi:RNA polymerase sigma-70 factor (ECF subfamily)
MLATRGTPEERIERARLEPDAVLGDLLDEYRSYLELLSRRALPRELAPKVGSSDIVQETMLKACAGFCEFRGRTEPELASWLRRILARCISDAVRRYLAAGARDVYRERRIEESVDGSAAVLADLIPASTNGPSTLAGRRELGVIVARALDELSPDHREVLVPRHVDGLDWPEIAARMERTRKAAGMLWTRALRSLRPHLEELDDGLP